MTKINAQKIKTLTHVGFTMAKADAAAERAIKSVLTKAGKMPKEYAAAFDAGAVAAILNYGETAEGLAKAQKVLATPAAKRTSGQKAAVLAARNRRSRLVKSLGIEAAGNAGRKRGTKMAPPASTKETAEAPVAGEGKMPKSVTPAVPTLVNAAEVMAYLDSKIAQIEAAQKKNAKHFTAKQRRALAEYKAAIHAAD